MCVCVCVKDGDSKLVEPSQPSCCGDVIETPECFPEPGCRGNGVAVHPAMVLLHLPLF